MRRWLFWLLLPVVAAGLAGCAAQEGSATYQVYFAAREGQFNQAALAAEERSLPDAGAGGTEIDGLLQLLLAGPLSETLQSPIPAGTELLDWSLSAEGVLTVDFSWRYGSLSGVNLTLADYSIALTLEQLAEVTQVAVTVEGEPLSYRSSQEIRGEDAHLTLF